MAQVGYAEQNNNRSSSPWGVGSYSSAWGAVPGRATERTVVSPPKAEEPSIVAGSYKPPVGIRTDVQEVSGAPELRRPRASGRIARRAREQYEAEQARQAVPEPPVVQAQPLVTRAEPQVQQEPPARQAQSSAAQVQPPVRQAQQPVAQTQPARQAEVPPRQAVPVSQKVALTTAPAQQKPRTAYAQGFSAIPWQSAPQPNPFKNYGGQSVPQALYGSNAQQTMVRRPTVPVSSYIRSGDGAGVSSSAAVYSNARGVEPGRQYKAQQARVAAPAPKVAAPAKKLTRKGKKAKQKDEALRAKQARKDAKKKKRIKGAVKSIRSVYEQPNGSHQPSIYSRQGSRIPGQPAMMPALGYPYAVQMTNRGPQRGGSVVVPYGRPAAQHMQIAVPMPTPRLPVSPTAQRGMRSAGRIRRRVRHPRITAFKKALLVGISVLMLGMGAYSTYRTEVDNFVGNAGNLVKNVQQVMNYNYDATWQTKEARRADQARYSAIVSNLGAEERNTLYGDWFAAANLNNPGSLIEAGGVETLLSGVDLNQNLFDARAYLEAAHKGGDAELGMRQAILGYAQDTPWAQHPLDVVIRHLSSHDRNDTVAIDHLVNAIGARMGEDADISGIMMPDGIPALLVVNFMEEHNMLQSPDGRSFSSFLRASLGDGYNGIITKVHQRFSKGTPSKWLGIDPRTNGGFGPTPEYSDIPSGPVDTSFMEMMDPIRKNPTSEWNIDLPPGALPLKPGKPVKQPWEIEQEKQNKKKPKGHVEGWVGDQASVSGSNQMALGNGVSIRDMLGQGRSGDTSTPPQQINPNFNGGRA